MLETGPAAAGGNMLDREYPPDEWRIVRQLVRLIGSAKTWQDMIEASDALFQVEMRAKCMRDEHAQHIARDAALTAVRQSNQGQSINPIVWGEPGHMRKVTSI